MFKTSLVWVTTLNRRSSLIFFTLLLLLTTLSLPYFPQGTLAMAHWWDQSIFIRALRDILAGNSSPVIDDGSVGAGYVVVAMVLTNILRVSPETSLILLNRTSFILTALTYFWLSCSILFELDLGSIDKTNHSQFFWQDKTKKSLLTTPFVQVMFVFLYTVFLLISTNFVSFSDVPWTHFLASYLVINGLLLLFKSDKARTYSGCILWSSLLYLNLGLLLQVRFFEGLTLSLALVLALLIKLFSSRTRRIYLKGGLLFQVCVAPICILLSSFVCAYFSQSSNLLSLGYFTTGSANPEMHEFTRLYLDTFPYKFIQLFVDPSFYSLKDVSYDLSPLVFGLKDVGLISWEMPLLLQVPVFLYSFIALVLWLFTALIAPRKIVDIREIPRNFLVVPLLVGGGLIVGYTSSAAAGSPHLRYGFVRDYMAPMWCLSLVTSPWLLILTVLHSPLKWRKLYRPTAVMLASLPVLICVVYAQGLVRYAPLPRFPSTAISAAEVSPICDDQLCKMSVTMKNQYGKVISSKFNRHIVAATCAETEEVFATTISSAKQVVRLPDCQESYDVKITPVITGLAATPVSPLLSWRHKP